MTADGFGVRHEELARLAGSLRTVAQGLEDRLGQATHAGQELVDHDTAWAAEAAFGQYTNAWEDYLRGAVGQVRGIAERIDTSVDAYQRTDESVFAALMRLVYG